MRYIPTGVVLATILLAGCFNSDTPIPPTPDEFPERPSDIPRVQNDKPVGGMDNTALIQTLGHEDTRKQRDAELKLVEQGPAVVAELINALADDNWHVRAGVIRALGLFEREAKDALPHLRQIVESDDEREEVRDAAAFNIPAIQGSEDNMWLKKH